MNRKLLYFVPCLLSLLIGGCQTGTPDKLRGTWHRFTTADGLIGNQVSAVAAESNGNVWFATDQGVSVLTAQRDWTHYRAADGLGADDARDVVIDQRGRVWVATRGGVSRFDGTTWQTFTSSNSNLPNDSAWRLAIDAQNNVWVLSLKGLSVIHNDGSVIYVGNPFSEQDNPFSLAIDSERHVWVVTRWGELLLAEYDPAEERWLAVERVTDHVELSAGANSPDIQGMAVDLQPGHLWIAANNIVEVEGEAWRVHLPEYKPTTVFVDSEGYKWFGVTLPHFGLLLLSPDNQQWWEYRGGQGALNPGVYGILDITCDSQGNYWFATLSGAIQFIPTK